MLVVASWRCGWLERHRLESVVGFAEFLLAVFDLVDGLEDVEEGGCISGVSIEFAPIARAGSTPGGVFGFSTSPGPLRPVFGRDRPGLARPTQAR